MWLFCYGFPNHNDKFCKDKTGISNESFYEYKKAWLAMFEWFYTNQDKKLGGKNKIVEIDEALLGKKH